MTVTNVTTLTVQPDGWDQMMENTKAANKIMEKYGAPNAPSPSRRRCGSIWHRALGLRDRRSGDAGQDPRLHLRRRRHADPHEERGETTSWTSSILMDLPLS